MNAKIYRYVPNTEQIKNISKFNLGSPCLIPQIRDEAQNRLAQSNLCRTLRLQTKNTYFSIGYKESCEVEKTVHKKGHLYLFFT